MSLRKRLLIDWAFLALMLGASWVHAAIRVADKISDVRDTKSNLTTAVDGATTPSGGKVFSRIVKARYETRFVTCSSIEANVVGLVSSCCSTWLE